MPPVIDKACILKRKIICTQLLCQASGPASLVRGWLAFTTTCLGNSARLPHALAPAGHMRSSDVVIDHRWLLHRMCCDNSSDCCIECVVTIAACAAAERARVVSSSSDDGGGCVAYWWGVGRSAVGCSFGSCLVFLFSVAWAIEWVPFCIESSLKSSLNSSLNSSFFSEFLK
jgi:hypothetical protein